MEKYFSDHTTLKHVKKISTIICNKHIFIINAKYDKKNAKTVTLPLSKLIEIYTKNEYNNTTK